MLSSAQQVKVSLSAIEAILALEVKNQLGVVAVAPDDLQTLVDTVVQEQARIDRVKQLYDYWDHYAGEKDYIFSSQTIAAIISDVLLILNIKIEGVNI